MKRRIALYGGAFDPIHNGHLTISKMIVRDFLIDKLYFIPSNYPPHKLPHKASKKDRLKMLLLAIGTLGEKYVISDYELKKDDISYTIDTVKYFKNRFMDDEIYFIVGSDIFGSIKTWKQYRELFNYAKFIVVRRQHYDFFKMTEEIGQFFFEHLNKGEIILYEETIEDISSTQIRNDQEYRYLPKSVRDYIIKNRLYIEDKWIH